MWPDDPPTSDPRLDYEPTCDRWRACRHADLCDWLTSHFDACEELTDEGLCSRCVYFETRRWADGA